METVGPPGGRDTTDEPRDPRVAAAAHGDRAAAEDLLLETLPRVRNLVRYLVRGDAVVDDLAQEALVAILQGLPTCRGEGPFAAWADRVTARTVFSRLRRGRAYAARLAVLGDELDRSPDGGARPDDYLARRRIVALLDELPDEQRHALVLHHVAGLSVPELALELDAPAETVRSRLRLGMRRLRASCGLTGTEPPEDGHDRLE
ncbi:MAG: sigma-70 family RNA polymerase sigma factor [Deltaproteobacteria bacterium]|nr:sigma-70 family RNA polymerase sigma factor [Deltaproteobacteria bacterium]